MPANPYEPPQEKPPPPGNSAGGLWPHSRARREKMIRATSRAWLLFILRTLIFAAVVWALLYLTRL